MNWSGAERHLQGWELRQQVITWIDAGTGRARVRDCLWAVVDSRAAGAGALATGRPRRRK